MKRRPEAQRVVRLALEVGGDHRPQEVAELEADRRAVVERPDAHGRDARGRVGRLAGQPVGEFRADVARWRHAAAVAGEPHEVGGPTHVHGEERVEHGRHEDRAPVVDLLGRLERSRIRVACPAPSAAPPGSRAPRRTGARARRAGWTRRPGHGSVRPPAVGRESARSSVEWMRPPVRRIVSRSASGNEKCWSRATTSANASWNARASGPDGSMKYGRTPSSIAWVVSWTTMSCDRQVNTIWPGRFRPAGRPRPGSTRTAAPAGAGRSRRWPRPSRGDRCAAGRRAAGGSRPRAHCHADRPPERRLEPLDRGAHDAVDHLLVEGRVEVARLEAAPEQHVERVQVGGAVVAVVRRVVVDDRDLAADRPRLQRLERHGDRHVVPERPAATRVEGEHLERAMVAVACRSRLREQRQAPSSAAGRLRDDVLQPARLVDDERGARVGPVGARRPPLDDLGDDLALAAAVRPDPARRADEGRVHLDPGPGRQADIGGMVVDEPPDPRGRETSLGPDQGLGGGQAPAGRLAPPEALLRVRAHARDGHPARAEAVDERLRDTPSRRWGRPPCRR